MPWQQLVLTIAAAILGSAGISAVVVKYLDRRVTEATEIRIRAEARQIATKTATDAATAETGVLRQVIEDLRTEVARHRAAREDVERRLDKLEERERHSLTRAAVHQAWDDLAFAFILRHDASFHPPPPLAPPALGNRDDSPDDN